MRLVVSNKTPSISQDVIDENTLDALTTIFPDIMSPRFMMSDEELEAFRESLPRTLKELDIEESHVDLDNMYWIAKSRATLLSSFNTLESVFDVDNIYASYKRLSNTPSNSQFDKRVEIDDTLFKIHSGLNFYLPFRPDPYENIRQSYNSDQWSISIKKIDSHAIIFSHLDGSINNHKLLRLHIDQLFPLLSIMENIERLSAVMAPEDGIYRL